MILNILINVGIFIIIAFSTSYFKRSGKGTVQSGLNLFNSCVIAFSVSIGITF